MEHKANQKLIKTLNEIRLLNIIKEEGPVSRSELAKKTRISKVAISDIVNRLHKTGFVCEIGKGESTSRGGKRPTLLKLNADNRFVIGLEIRRRHTTIMIANIDSDIKAREQFQYAAGTSSQKIMPILFETIDTMLERCDISIDKLVSIGIGIPGFVNYTKGKLLFADTMHGWGDFPLASFFMDRYQVPAIVENDVNNITLGESLMGSGRERSNLACIWIGEGVGSGILMDGKLVRGATGSAGEIGYLELGHFVNLDCVKDLYSGQRYFGEILSERNLLDTLMMKLQQKVPDQNEDLEHQTLHALLKRGDEGDQVIQHLLDEYAYLLSTLCTHYIKTLNPNLILLSGQVIEHSRYLVDKVRQVAQNLMVDLTLQPTSIVVGELGEEAGVKGAIAMALQQIFEPPVTRNTNLATVML